MPHINWDDKYLTGNLAVDNQHKQLFTMVNELHEGIVAQRGKEVMGPVLRKLAKYTVEHFKTEESMMDQKAYPNMVRHKAKHKELTDQVVDLMAKFEAGTLSLPLTLSSFLSDWITHHIRDEDKALIEWMRNKV